MRELPEALRPLGVYRQFIVYRIVPSSTRPGKLDKFPCDFRSGLVVSAHDEYVWTDHLTAIASAANLGESYGIGFVFTESDPFWFLDLDSCLLPSGEWSDVAKQMCQVFAGCAVEISLSGIGLHLFGTGTMPKHSCKNTLLGMELYHAGRFVALTGIGAIGNAAHDATQYLPWLVESYFKPDATTVIASHADGPCAEWCGPTDDDELIKLAMSKVSASSAFGGKASFKDLWEGNHEVLGRFWPAENRPYDASSADAALAQHLAFWTGKDSQRIYRLMMLSALRRGKWDRDDYMNRTITGACSRQHEVYSKGARPDVATEHKYFVLPSDEPFKGCVYIKDHNVVFTPDGQLLKPDVFRVAYGCHSYYMDPTGTKQTDDAWKAFTNNQFAPPPKADRTQFYPDKPAGAIIETEGVKYLNIYFPVEVPRKVGDATPFFEHLTKVLPDENDREILLSYMAACVQHIGVKFQWAPLLQGVEGNGKSLFTRCVAKAIGERYTHLPRASELDEKFNSWLFNKLFIGVEDIYVPDKKKEIIEILKPMITGENLERRAMQQDQTMQNVCANFIFNSNHKNAINKTDNERRFCVLFCAQQKADHLYRDGMNGDYFPKLYGWLKNDGYAIVAELLHTMPINPKFNPARDCQRAPYTSTTSAAIKANKGAIEQEIEEWIAQDKPGFKGGWISSIMLERELERVGAAKRITHAMRREILETMGYVQHPALKDGRVNQIVTPDGGRPKLFIRSENPSVLLTKPSEIEEAYRRSNEFTFGVYK